ERGEGSEGGIQAHTEWQLRRFTTREVASTPSIDVTTATEYAVSPAVESRSDLGAIKVESTGETVSRPHGKRFGTLVHATLAMIELDSDRAAVQNVAELQGRLLGSTPDEISAATETVARALSHPLLRRAAIAQASGHCRRETQVSLVLDSGSLVEGVVDLAFFDSETGRWTVVDFKTDVELEGRLEEYRLQVGLYVEAISKAVGVVTDG